MPPDLSQLLGSLLGVTGAAGTGPGGAPSITVTTSGVPAFIQGVSEFMQQVSALIFDMSALRYCLKTVHLFRYITPEFVGHFYYPE